MRRADRLFQLVQFLRRGRVVTAAELARELEVSERTIYRDVRDLVASGVPIEGEAGVGYLLPRGFDLPPLMFTEEELETLVLGARMVASWAGPDFARRARSLLTKVESAVPERLAKRLDSVALFAPGFHVSERVTTHLEPLSRACRERRRVHFRDERADGQGAERTVRPLGLTFWGTAWTLTAWCELRDDFRNFRPDRIDDLDVLEERFPDEPGRDLASYLRLLGE